MREDWLTIVLKWNACFTCKETNLKIDNESSRNVFVFYVLTSQLHSETDIGYVQNEYRDVNDMPGHQQITDQVRFIDMYLPCAAPI